MFISTRFWRKKKKEKKKQKERERKSGTEPAPKPTTLQKGLALTVPSSAEAVQLPSTTSAQWFKRTDNTEVSEEASVLVIVEGPEDFSNTETRETN